MQRIGDQPASCMVSGRPIDKDHIRTEGTETSGHLEIASVAVW